MASSSHMADTHRIRHVSSLHDIRPFDLVSDQLRNIGAISVPEFLSGIFENKDWLTTGYSLQTLYTDQSTSETTSSHDQRTTTKDDTNPTSRTTHDQNEDLSNNKNAAAVGTSDANGFFGDSSGTASTSQKGLPALVKPMMDPSVRMQNIASLHQACQRTFRSSQALKFDFVEDNGVNRKQCILTITRPDGSVRSFKTDPIFSRKGDAKVQAAAIAVNHGALDFIINGESAEAKARKGTLLVPLHSMMGEVERTELKQGHKAEGPGVAEIEDCCLEWRAGRVRPLWVSFFGPTPGKNCGMALRISLTRHSYRVYASDACHATQDEAKAACAAIALLQGVIDYIKYGNGQTEPAKPEGVFDDPMERPSKRKAMTLEEFYESLPRPFPEPVEGATAHQINASAWLNLTMQSARGGRIRTNFYFYVDPAVGLHGAILRLDRPGDSKTYLVDPIFGKRNDAKSAVCLLAMSDGVGDYIRLVKQEVDARALHDKKIVNEACLLLAAECVRIDSDVQPSFSYPTDRDAFGCIMTINIPEGVKMPSPPTYEVANEYRTKADAKAAVVTQSIDRGIIDFLRLRGKPPPTGHTPFTLSQFRSSEQGTNYKRKGVESDSPQGSEVQSPKKRKMGGKLDRCGAGQTASDNNGPPVPIPRADRKDSDSKGSRRNKEAGSPRHKGDWEKPEESMRNNTASSNSTSASTGKPGRTPRSASRNVGRPATSAQTLTPAMSMDSLPATPSQYPLTSASSDSSMSQHPAPSLPPQAHNVHPSHPPLLQHMFPPYSPPHPGWQPTSPPHPTSQASYAACYPSYGKPMAYPVPYPHPPYNAYQPYPYPGHMIYAYPAAMAYGLPPPHPHHPHPVMYPPPPVAPLASPPGHSQTNPPGYRQHTVSRMVPVPVRSVPTTYPGSGKGKGKGKGGLNGKGPTGNGANGNGKGHSPPNARTGLPTAAVAGNIGSVNTPGKGGGSASAPAKQQQSGGEWG